MKNADSPAFPQTRMEMHKVNDGDSIEDYDELEIPYNGLTKREWFASVAMEIAERYIKKSDYCNPKENELEIAWLKRYSKTLSEIAYIIADAMIKESEKGI
ncbi:MAG: hypothetical protein GF317_04660 [Candidatus Lokiarchaeota archaeon]|nr:hypothetical protein [Candidatus Lokiarchaeota archaeon]